MPVKKPEERIYPGQKICKLTVLSPAEEGRFGSPHWKVRCDCGNHRIMRREFLRKKPFPNCGCYNPVLQAEPNIKHGLEGNPLTRIWRAMKQRCENPECDHYYLYGGRGIKICDRWSGDDGLKNFVDDMYPTYKKGLQIDRIDNDGEYEPGNCHWVTRKQNGRNKRSNRLVRTAIGTKTLVEQSEVSGVPTYTIRDRLDHGVPEEMSIIPNGKGRWLHPEELKKLDKGEAIWMDTKAGREAARVVETAEIQAEAIKDWGFGPKEIILAS